MTSSIRALRAYSIIVFLVQFNFSIGQQIEFINGKLVDSKDATSIPFATIKIKNKSKGLISNLDGGFRIPYELVSLKDTLVISSMGYKTKEIPLTDLSKNQINYIRLSEKVEMLAEVVLIDSKIRKRLKAKEIVRKAIKRIPENFPFEPFSYIGYYRDYQLKDSKYLNLKEAILEVFDPGFGFEDLKNTQTKIYNYKTNIDFPIDTLAAKPYDYINRSKIINNATLDGQGGNEYTILRLHDALRNHNINTYDFINRLDIDLIKNHRLKLSYETSLNDIPLYVVNLIKNQTPYKVQGKIFISKGDFHIYKLEYNVYDTKNNKGQKQSNSFKEANEKIPGKLLYQIIVEYQLHKDRMYPNYISFNNSFEVLQPPKFIPDTVKVNHDKKFFEVVFNNPPVPSSARKKNRYRLWYQGIYLAIDSIVTKNKSVRLYPKQKSWVFDSKRIQSQRKTTNKGITLEVKNVVDIYGNEVHKSESTSYSQFREFFVQQLNSNNLKSTDGHFMLKTRPLHKNQAIVAPKNLTGYWMNTPLKSNKNN
ncbi:carboxypeptidase-like regulatory domain-containing protein [Spongiivirga citrea]|uniref:Carboxypeptidase-like regulatory domain-containing protein n=1 Tax=Spongiivirga citrea TaxID=1481457 RepID=A0A6M0CIX2_9FLAO|nr:carboxypeptidase-like regulatory domain-containing protein [Spongiivirga citrea]NER15934.1 hypothetical protein [Spongiivirga citrea]